MGARRVSLFCAVAAVLAAGLGAVGAQANSLPLRVAATTSIVGDVVRAVGGADVTVTVLLPVGADPHTFEPTPKEMAALAGARLVFVNGGGLEAFVTPLLDSAGVPVVSASEGVPFRTFSSGGEEQGTDPHVWFDPANVSIWAGNIARALASLDPEHADGYAARALAYQQALLDLDGWIERQVATLPQEERVLVSDHEDFGYFARRYGFDEVGTVIPSLSTLAEPSAQGLAALETAIRERGVRAVFVGMTVNPTLAEQVAGDTGARVVFLYTEALSAAGGPASTYLDLMRYDVEAIVRALTGGP